MTATVTVTPKRLGLGGNDEGYALYYIPATTKSAQSDIVKVLGVSSILVGSVQLVASSALTALENVTTSTNEITCASANTGTVSGYIMAKL